MRATKIHYAGSLRIRTKSGGLIVIIGGWAACCSGPRADRIRAQGMNTHDAGAVTCSACLRRVEQARRPE